MLPDPRHAEAPPGMLRVLVVFHESESLGAGTSVLRVLPELANYGWTASGWFPSDGPLRSAAAEYLAAIHAQDRPLAFSRRGWQAPPGVPARVAGLPSYLRAFTSALCRVRPHVLHANTLLALPEAMAARLHGIPLVVQVHEIPRPGTKRAAAIHAAARVADVLVGVSNAVTTTLRSQSGTTPVLMVHNGVPAVTAASSSHDRQVFTIGTVGTVSRLKGTETFLRAARAALAERPDIRFEHVGAPHLHRDPGLDSELGVILAERGPDSRITMLGTQDPAAILPRWSVFVLSSRSEGFPLATLEAMAHGLPVIATAVGGVPEQIDHLRSGILVQPDDYGAIAAWMVRLHDDPDLRHRLGAEAAARVRSSFTLSRQAEGLHRAYVTALNRRFGPPVVRRRAHEAA